MLGVSSSLSTEINIRLENKQKVLTKSETEIYQSQKLPAMASFKSSARNSFSFVQVFLEHATSSPTNGEVHCKQKELLHIV